ncbi:hypothetical protein ARMSODRAFT_343267 [Armillaria solidipes]|uniref:Uncharacterized protein n=1 Tax=Armillaria solidipes TaxID=1076256 RepID=A0A2H3B7B0_9AGAR|nr:hypothetical protein ARMSODRAFT_343267 [Armillaria solidipes]
MMPNLSRDGSMVLMGAHQNRRQPILRKVAIWFSQLHSGYSVGRVFRMDQNCYLLSVRSSLVWTKSHTRKAVVTPGSTSPMRSVDLQSSPMRSSTFRCEFSAFVLSAIMLPNLNCNILFPPLCTHSLGYGAAYIGTMDLCHKHRDSMALGETKIRTPGLGDYLFRFYWCMYSKI